MASIPLPTVGVRRRLQETFDLAGCAASNREGPSKTYYDRKRAEGKRHDQALLCLARRLVDVIWALTRDSRTFTLTAPPNTRNAAA